MSTGTKTRKSMTLVQLFKVDLKKKTNVTSIPVIMSGNT